MKPVIIIAIAFVLLIPIEISALTTDLEYKDAVYSLKSSYHDLISDVEKQIKLSESALSGLNFESSEAKKKIESAWESRGNAWVNHGAADKKLKETENLVEARFYKSSYFQFSEIDDPLVYAKNGLNNIIIKIKNAKDLEKKYQEDQRFCFLWWCSETKNTYGVLDPKIKNMESKLDELKNKLENFKKEKISISASIQQKIVIENKNQEIQQLENLRKQEQYEADRQEMILQEQIRQAQREYEAQIEAEKQSTLNILAAQNPLLKQIMTGEITFWAESVPYYAAPGVNDSVETILNSFDSWSGVRRVYNEGSADIRIQWIKEFSPHQGGQYWQNQIQVGLGQTGCKGEWQPFVSHSVRQVLWHEIGHAMGHGHSSDQNNIMMGNGLQKYYEKEYEDDIFLEDGHFSWISFCQSGQYTFTLKGSSESNGFRFYVITPETDASKFIIENEGLHYPDCTKTGLWVSYTKTCDVSKGSYLLVYNPRDNGKTINVDVTTQYTGGKKAYTMTWDKNSLREPTQYLQYLDSLR